LEQRIYTQICSWAQVAFIAATISIAMYLTHLLPTDMWWTGNLVWSLGFVPGYYLVDVDAIDECFGYVTPSGQHIGSSLHGFRLSS